jgi:hypothetical protein
MYPISTKAGRVMRQPTPRESCGDAAMSNSATSNFPSAADRGIFPLGPGLRCAYPGYGLLQLADGRAGFARRNPE